MITLFTACSVIYLLHVWKQRLQKKYIFQNEGNNGTKYTTEFLRSIFLFV